MSNDGIEKVRAAMAAGETVDLPEDMDLPDEGDQQPDPQDPGASYNSDTPAPPDADGPNPPRDCAHFPLNDFGNGQRFYCHFGEDVLWVPRVGWFVWSGTRWQKDADEIEARRRAQKLSSLIEQEVPYLVLEEWQMEKLGQLRAVRIRARELDDVISRGGEEAEAARTERDTLSARLADLANLEKVLTSKRKDHRGFARTSGNTARIQAAMTEAQTSLARPLDLLDAQPLDVNCASGVLRFSVDPTGDMGFGPAGTVQLLEHARDLYATKIMPVEFDPRATCPIFDAYLQRVQPQPEMRGFLQRWLGLSMTALTGEQKLCFFYGGGANGKSVLVDLIARMMGDYASTAKIESLTGRNRRGGGDATPDLVPLMGARFVRASEPEEGEKLQEGIIKELTGGEPMLIRALHSDFVEVKPIFKLTISGNHKPEIRGLDDGIWRRVLLVPFDVQIPKHERDPNLGDKLWAERSGILNWLVEGLQSYLVSGLQEPAAVLDATREYREESDPIGMFLDTACVVSGDPADSLYTKDLVAAFNFWLDRRGEGQWGDKTISRRLKEKSRNWRSPKTGKGFTDRKSSGIMRYDGIRFADTFRKDLPTDIDGHVTWTGARRG
ncbi:DNA primase family protein [Paracoccus tibetensis]|uniref:Putative DNA primase/helicase n=1 Tax=Paracoccus tibetensis TaxID=336292 RepID=A0A1G5BFC9_9RHOB|nr:DNA primase family protein [Paracoccus tibetensis]SCX88847.1 putative DNA primase/helicase [Paracoccus tibetensis]